MLLKIEIVPAYAAGCVCVCVFRWMCVCFIFRIVILDDINIQCLRLSAFVVMLNQTAQMQGLLSKTATNELLNVSPYFCAPLSPLQRVWRRSLCSQHCKVPPVSGTRAAHHPAAGPVAQRGWWHGYAVGPHALCAFYRTAAEDWRTAGNFSGFVFLQSILFTGGFNKSANNILGFTGGKMFNKSFFLL